jgi:hypothetical protein
MPLAAAQPSSAGLMPTCSTFLPHLCMSQPPHTSCAIHAVNSSMHPQYAKFQTACPHNYVNTDDICTRYVCGAPCSGLSCWVGRRSNNSGGETNAEGHTGVGRFVPLSTQLYGQMRVLATSSCKVPSTSRECRNFVAGGRALQDLMFPRQSSVWVSWVWRGTDV